MSENKKSSIPLAGELWINKHYDFLLFITEVGTRCLNSVTVNADGTRPPDEHVTWVWWDNLTSNFEGNASLNWFISNCEKIS